MRLNKFQSFFKELEIEKIVKMGNERNSWIFKCLDCDKEDEVTDYVLEAFHPWEEGEKVEVDIEVVCPFCEGTMRSTISE